MPGASLYRGDLARILAADPGSLSLEFVGQLCGFTFAPIESPQERTTETDPLPPTLLAVQESQEQERAPKPKPKLRFWRAESLEVEPEDTSAQRHQVPPEIAEAPLLTSDDLMYPESPLTGQPLLPWSRLWPFLREVLGRRKPSRSPDLPRVVRLLATGRPMLRLPRKLRRAWHPQVQVLLDRRDALAPYWDDYDHLLRRIKLMRGGAGLEIAKLEILPYASDDPGATGFARADYPGKRTPPSEISSGLPPFRLPPSNTALLVLGDLGHYLPAAFQALWLSLGRKLRNRGLVPWALCPCPRTRWSPSMARTWNLACWDRGQHLPMHGEGQEVEPHPEDERATTTRRQLDALFPLLAPAIRVERGLLRDLRFLLAAAEADVGAEYDAFQAPESMGQISGFTIQANRLRELRNGLAALDPTLLARVVATVRRHHEYCQEVFGQMETLGLMAALPPERLEDLLSRGALPAGAQEQAREFWRRMVRTIWTRPSGFDAAGTSIFGGRDWQRLPAPGQQAPELQAVWALANPGDDRVLPETVNPEWIAWLQTDTGPEENHGIRVAEGLVAGGPPGRGRGFPLGSLRSSRGSFFATPRGEAVTLPTRELSWCEQRIIAPNDLHDVRRLVLSSGRETLHLEGFERPPWAERMWYDRRGLAAQFGGPRSRCVVRWQPPETSLDGHPLSERFSHIGSWETVEKPAWMQVAWVDQFGAAAQFSIGGVPFILRWIPPGRFLMGSPDDEAGRFDYEGPQHEVTISRGFWLGETPVTQAQWRAVVEAGKSDPSLLSRLIGKKTELLNSAPSHHKGLGTLPVEQVSWNDGVAFGRLLDRLLPGGPAFSLPTEAQWEYACRAGTRGAFHVEGSQCTESEGEDPALEDLGWYGKNSGGETKEVKLKRANEWGLYDMHGNVWEWCRDAWENNYQARAAGATDPEVRVTNAGAPRVIRGGSWILSAQDCRAAYRSRYGPGYRWDSLGLRLSAGQELRAAEPAGAERPGAAEGRSGRKKKKTA